MRFVKSIGFFLVYPLLMLMLGFLAGIKAVEFFYPGNVSAPQEAEPPMGWEEFIEEYLAEKALEESGAAQEPADVSGEVSPVVSNRETLSADTEYILKEMDIIRQTEVETTWRLPQKYIGMDREQFLTAINSYGDHPPLSELERGFVGLEVLAFSRERVIVQMNYEYLQPGEEFYLAVLDNEVVVLLDDQETVYIYTGISLDKFPETVQMQIMQMMWMEDEESLYGFLETYSS
ncbi:MAG: hypothetical protein NC417_07935 [Candidatus Gastranaerophilales bacterium]|nr:hypothetical protein [Candidatus Gastranaerophilales bacterium]